ncbi:MAG: hypothetical protein ABIQ99_13185 [Thermoflexales bacterium]
MRFGSRLVITVVTAFGLAAPGLAPVAAQDGDPGQAPAGADLLEAALVLAPAAPAAPVTRNYPGGAPCNSTLQACISGSADGDTVVIAANTYLTASLSITRAVNLVGGGPLPSSVKLRPTSGRMLTYSGVALTATYVLSNVMVENAVNSSGSGGGIRINGDAPPPLFYGIVISNNQATVASLGGGIRVITPMTVTILNSVIFSNTTVGDGGGISVAGSLYMENSRVEANTAGGAGGGVIADGAIVISNTRFISNTANTGGGLHGPGGMTLTNAFFDKNVALTGSGGAIFALNSSFTVALVSTSFVSRTQIINNSASAHGGGLYTNGGVFIKGEGRFSNNKALNGEGGGFYIGRNLVDDFPNNVDNI